MDDRNEHQFSKTILIGKSDLSDLYKITFIRVNNQNGHCNLTCNKSKNPIELWHRWLAHLNFDDVNDLVKKGLIPPDNSGENFLWTLCNGKTT